jgi:hypothetical protein
MTSTTTSTTHTLSSSPSFFITQSTTTERDSETQEVLSKTVDTVLDLRYAPVPNSDFAVFVNRDGEDSYSAVLLGVTGLRTDLDIIGAIRLWRPPAPNEPPRTHLRAPGDGPLCMRGSREALPELMAAAFKQLIPKQAGPVTVERTMGTDSACGSIRARVRRAIEAAGNPPNGQQRMQMRG